MSAEAIRLKGARGPLPWKAAVVAAAVLLLTAGAAAAQDAHGAIAFGHITQDQAVAYGFVWNYPSKDEAQDAAMNACLNSGGSDCTVLAWFQNGCGALAVDQYGMAQGKSARTQEQAEARALQTCEAAGGVGCAVVGSLCVSPGGEPDTWSGSESVLAVPEETAPEEGEQGSGPTAAAPQDEDLTREERMQVQQGLAALGFDAGPADGMFGPRTRSAIWEWQQAKGLQTTGYLSREEAEVLAAAGAESREQPESRETAEPDGSRNQVLLFPVSGPKCADLGSNLGEKHAACWEEIQSQPGCYIWNEHYHSDRTMDWTGGCAGDTAHGRGSYSLSSGSEHKKVVGTGAVVYGKYDGHWVFRWDGNVSEGPFVDGKPDGHWVFRWAGGGGSEGPFVDGKRHGHWVERWADGGGAEGPYVDGKYHGHWVNRYANGTAVETEWRNGSREGQPGVFQDLIGTRFHGRWSDGCLRSAWGSALASDGSKTLEECRS